MSEDKETSASRENDGSGPAASPYVPFAKVRQGASAGSAPCSLAALGDARAVEQLAREQFGVTRLRDHQLQVLAHLGEGRDVLAILPTGAGKTLCYGVPALLAPGITLVIAPLVALMHDQVRRFTAVGVPAVAFDSLQSPASRDEAWRRVESGEAKLVFVAPERLARVDFRQRLGALPVDLVAIDEAHCISHWGGGFRPEYRQLGALLAPWPDARRLALTATATARVRDDIRGALGIPQAAVVAAPAARENLTLEVVRAGTVAAHRKATLDAVLAEGEGTGLVYAPTRKDVDDITRMLAAAGIAAVAYHAGLGGPARAAAQQAFVSGRARVAVATNAFGLGIDKADVRFVHHAGLPGSLEQYVQEIGRAGRDGLPARCALVWGGRDFHVQKFLLERSYPEAQVLENALDVALAVLDQRLGSCSRASLLVALTGAGLGRDAAAALDLLCREGVLAELRTRGTGGVSARAGAGRGTQAGAELEETLITGGDTLPADLWAEYPARRAAQRERLEAMRAYAELADDAGRIDYLESYFGLADAGELPHA
jgi:ATP-dependent DNA helicase RecQ